MESLKDMIQDIFDLSKSTSGTAELHLETLDMKKLLEQTLGGHGGRHKEAAAWSSVRLCLRCPSNSQGTAKKCTGCSINLIGNALKYSLAGTRIYIIAERRASQVQVTIKNTAAYEMDFTSEEIMERFARGDKSRNTEGHGLGLAIAESFVKNMERRAAGHRGRRPVQGTAHLSCSGGDEGDGVTSAMAFTLLPASPILLLSCAPAPQRSEDRPRAS